MRFFEIGRGDEARTLVKARLILGSMSLPGLSAVRKLLRDGYSLETDTGTRPSDSGYGEGLAIPDGEDGFGLIANRLGKD